MTKGWFSRNFCLFCLLFLFFHWPPLSHTFLHEFSIWQSLSFFAWHRPKAGVLISKCGMLTVASYKSFPFYRYNCPLCVLSLSFMSDLLKPHGLQPIRILQARILEWVAIPFSSGSSRLRDLTWVLHCRWILYHLSYWGSLKLSLES